jgi:hypothetical protein
MRLLEEGMIVAVRNFKSKTENQKRTEIIENSSDKRFTLLVISRIWPDHYGLRVYRILLTTLCSLIIEQSVMDWEGDDMSTMMIQLNAIPINYDLIVHEDDGSYEFAKVSHTQ